MSIRNVLFIFGTRPEAIKLAPVIRELQQRPDMAVRICVTAQHREMLDQVLRLFEITPDYDLNVMTPGQSLSESTGRILLHLAPVLREANPDLIIVQGDTTTTLCGAMTGFYANIPVGHVEAGLRTGDLRQPFPEEMNRVVVSRLAAIHFAATEQSAENLYREGIRPERVHVTGNPGIDAVLYVRDSLADGRAKSHQFSFADSSKRLVLVTAHRRENFGVALENISSALRSIADLPGVDIVYPVHPNPNVARPVRRMLQGHPAIHLIEPVDYVGFVDLMRRAYVILTDSGGIQEEAPSLGKPVLVMRDKTERPEAVNAGTCTLVGTDPRTIMNETARLLRDDAEYRRRSRTRNPYGDGTASRQIGAAIAKAFLNGCLKI